jgi:hypothetical protein
MPREASTKRKVRVSLLGAALFLGEFCAESLADHAQVGIKEARAFLDEGCATGLIEPILPAHSLTLHQEVKGAPTTLYRVCPGRREELLRRLAEHRREPTRSSVTSDHAPKDAEDYSPLALLEATLAALAACDLESSDEWQELIDQAKIRLRGAEADLGVFIANGADLGEILSFATRVEAARKNLTTASIPRPAVLPATNNLSTKQFVEFLRDWTAALSVPALRREAVEPFSAHRTLEFVDFTLRRAAARPRVESAVFEPTYLLLQGKGAWEPAASEIIAAQVCERIRAFSANTEPLVLAALSVMAAALEIHAAAEPVMIGLLLPGVMERMLAQHRRTCLMALAHLARPRLAIRDNRTLAAASVCHYLLLRAESCDDDLDILAPAALQAPGADAGKLLHHLAKSIFAHNGMKADWRKRTDEGSLARNLALAIQAPGFPLLRKHLSDLLEDSAGRSLIARMTAPEHEALDLTDTNSSASFIVRLGRRTAAYLSSGKPFEVPLVLSGKAADKLSDLLTSRNWNTRAPMISQLPTAFSAQLGRRNTNRATSGAH